MKKFREQTGQGGGHRAGRFKVKRVERSSQIKRKSSGGGGERQRSRGGSRVLLINIKNRQGEKRGATCKRDSKENQEKGNKPQCPNAATTRTAGGSGTAVWKPKERRNLVLEKFSYRGRTASGGVAGKKGIMVGEKFVDPKGTREDRLWGSVALAQARGGRKVKRPDSYKDSGLKGEQKAGFFSWGGHAVTAGFWTGRHFNTKKRWCKNKTNGK